VAVVTTVDPSGTPHGFTCNALSAVSPDPPLLLVCAAESSRTLPPLLATGAFVVHLLADDGEQVARTFASRSARKFDDLPWSPSEAAAGAPVLGKGVLAAAECTLVHAIGAGDHRILLGRMEQAQVRPRRPVLYQQGRFTAWDILAETAVQL
jgi:3-hydroxy-9,10-secoandrosta-1,3,5(10)-triene-9,17-dione monooxygenase reductase component